MPSDLPSQAPPGAAVPSGLGAAPAGVGTGGTGTGAAGGAAPGTAGGAGTDVRRYSAQNRTGQSGPEKPAGISNSFALAMIVAFAVVAAVMIRQGPGLLQPPPRELAPLPGVNASVATSAPPPVSANSLLVQAYGSGTVNTAARQAQRVGQAGALAALCGLQSRAWVNDVREAMGKQLASTYPTFDPEVNAVQPMQAHIVAHYLAGQQTAQKALEERGKEALCADLPYSPDYRMAVRVGEQANLRAR